MFIHGFKKRGSLQPSRATSLLEFLTWSPGERTVAIGVGSGGCRILRQVQRGSKTIGRFVYISCEEQDLAGAASADTLLLEADFSIKNSPADIRGLALRYREQIRGLLYGSKMVFVIAGLGGSVGSGLAPLIATVANDLAAAVVGIAAMPYRFEKNLHFRAAVALRKFRRASDALILIDNDELLGAAGTMPILDAYAMVNEKISYALNRIVEVTDDKEFSLGLHKVLASIAREGYAILSVHATSAATPVDEAVVAAAQAVHRTAGAAHASSILLHLAGSSHLTPGDLEQSVTRLGRSFGDDTTEVHFGLSVTGDYAVTAVVLASGFPSTKFDLYDPVHLVLGDRAMDEGLDTEVDVPFPWLTRLE